MSDATDDAFAAIVDMYDDCSVPAGEAAPEQPTSRDRFVEALWADTSLSAKSKIVVLIAYDNAEREQPKR